MPNERIVGTIHTPFLEVHEIDTFERFEDNKTRISNAFGFTLPGGRPMMLGEPFVGTYLDHALEMTGAARKTRIEAGIPPGATR